jgi:hypothetical protein
MDEEKVNILVFGLLSTGSSALFDLFREYDNINIIPGEFDDFRAPGLVADQLSHENSIDFPNKIDNITGFRRKIRLVSQILPILKFIKSPFALKGVLTRYHFSLIRYKQINLLKKLNKELKANIPYTDKIQAARRWIKDVGNIQGKNKDFVVFNQPLLTGVDTRIWQEVFSPYKLICVYRDPKDQFADIIKNNRLVLAYGAPTVNSAGVILETIYGRNRKGAIDFHIDAMKKRLEWLDSMRKELNTDNFLLIDFEGLVTKYDQYKMVIENFIGINAEYHVKPKSFFSPGNGLKGIGIFEQYLDPTEKESLSELGKWYKNMNHSNSKYFS